MAVTGYYNPYKGRSQSDILGAWGRATAGNTVATGEADWINPAKYGNDDAAYGTMLDTVGNRFLAELGVDIADRQARRTFVQNALNLRNYSINDAAQTGNVSGDGSVKSAMGQYGDGFFQQGNMPTSPYKDAQATIQQNIANAKAAGTYKQDDPYYEFINKSKTRSAIEAVTAAQLAGPYRDMVLDQFETAGSAGSIADPYTGYWGTLKNYSPFQGGTSSAAAYVPPVAGGIGSAGPTYGVDDVGYDPNDETEGSHGYGSYAWWKAQHPGGTRAQFTALTTAGNPTSAPTTPETPSDPNHGPGGPGGVATRPGVPTPPVATIQPVGTGVPLNPGAPTPYAPAFDRNEAQGRIAATMRNTLGMDADPAQLKYWLEKAEAWGIDEALNRMQDNSATRAVAFYRQNGTPIPPPRIASSNDVDGIRSYHDWLIDAGQARPEEQAQFMQGMAALYAQAGM